MKPTTVLIAGLLFLFAAPAARSQQSKTTRVLFIGNSYTYFNNLPEVFARLAEAGRGKIETTMLAPGGWRLKDHWEKGRARGLLESGKWDFVVLQEQSTLGANYWVDGKDHVNSDAVFRPYAEKWAAAAQEKGATPVFFLTWSAKNVPEDQSALTYAYTRVAKDTGSLLAPVGMAWETIRRGELGPGLFYEGHGSHPSPAGTYLAACVLYATIFRQSPIGLPSKFVGTPVNLDTEKPEAGKSATLVDLSANEAERFQTIAWSTWQLLAGNMGYPEVSPPQVPSVPPLPAGLPLSAQDLEGTWEGTTLLYPVGPANLILRVQNALGLKAHLEIKYRSRSIPDESIELSDFRIRDSSLFFTDPKSTGLDNLTVRLTGVMVKPGELQGTAEARTETAEVHGSWSLKKMASPTQ